LGSKKVGVSSDFWEKLNEFKEKFNWEKFNWAEAFYRPQLYKVKNP
jgi:hypothetical protein